MLNEVKTLCPGLDAQGTIKLQPRYYWNSHGVRISFNYWVTPVNQCWYYSNQLCLPTELTQNQAIPDQNVLTFLAPGGLKVSTPWELQRQLWQQLISLPASVKRRREGSDWNWFFLDVAQAHNLLTWMETACTRWPSICLANTITAVWDQQPEQTLVIKQASLKKFRYKIILRKFTLDHVQCDWLTRLSQSFPGEIQFSPWLNLVLDRFNNPRGFAGSRRIPSSHIYTVNHNAVMYWQMLAPQLTKKVYELQFLENT